MSETIAQVVRRFEEGKLTRRELALALSALLLMPSEARAQETDWTFGGSWPYEPRWFESVDGRMHYVDVGPADGTPVVLVHGNPTWGYLYRHFVAGLVEAGHRAIVPDHLGFGRSDKPDDAQLYAVPRHADRLNALLESLDLHDATVVCQDWGGPISLRWATRHPERVRGLFILNTWVHRPRKPVTPLPFITQLWTPGVGEMMAKGRHVFVKNFLFEDGVTKPERLTSDVRAAYLAPHPSYETRTPVLAFAREIRSGAVADMNHDIEEKLRAHFRSKPVRMMWAMKDPALTPAFLDMWLGTFPDAEVTRIEDAGHYLQEDAHEVIVPALVDFVGR